MTSKNDEFKTIMMNNQCTGNLVVTAKLKITTLTKLKQNKAIGNGITSSRLSTTKAINTLYN